MTFKGRLYKSLGEPSLALLVNNPNKFFGQETHVITVRQDDNENISTIDVSEGGDITEVSNGTPLTLNGLNDWVYIPFNYEYKSRNKEFLSKLEEKNIDIDKLKNDPEYIQDETVKDTIKKIYKGISGNINQNSMFLYSGPKENPHSHYSKRRCYYYKIYCWWSGCYTCHCEPYKVACLYTGDGDLNGVKVKAIYRKYWNFIGTIQIPHHGSLNSFDANVLDDMHFCCPISVGQNNSYGHPSQRVISDILKFRSFPVLITENVNSTFIEVIYCCRPNISREKNSPCKLSK